MEFNRKMYNAIRKYDRQQMETYLKGVYSQGFRHGTESGNNADFKIKLVQVLNATKGIGPTLFDRILETSKKME